MEELLQRIIEACAAYYLEELDDAGFQKVINEIPATVWQDKEFVLKVLELDTSAVMKVPDQLAADEEFKVYVEESIDLEDVVQSFPEGKLPQWIKDWMK